MTSTDLYDVLIIGAGPAGLTAGIYAARANLKSMVFGIHYDSQLAKAGIVENYPGFPDGLQGLEISELIYTQTKNWGCEVFTANVKKLEKNENGLFKVITADDKRFTGYSLILATGAYYRKLDVPGEEELYLKGVSYCTICDGALFGGRDTIVAGYGNGAAKGALYLGGLGSSVTILCTKEELKCESTYMKRLEELQNIKVLYSITVNEIIGEDRVTGVVFTDKEGKINTLKTSAVFVEGGTAPNAALAKDLGIELTKNGFIKVNKLQATNIDGVFAAGDVTGGRRQIATAIGEGSSAAISAINWVRTHK
ncbi:NAD(P)/FAD-dependent oxidoreductase [Candidatus Borrarchaeum sp.]|uniref:NAD(P)/FAD-dependent oxidoreductase n=1 Tax=Candidatus Borrarchaeum sp. TaxID=2846742 RepID=UPI00257B1EA7|nr:FAD-dependent oxidoreductase [Candidatus Borrarchaeum sp.]